MQRFTSRTAKQFLYEHRLVIVGLLCALIVIAVVGFMLAKERAILTDPIKVIDKLATSNVIKKDLYVNPSSNAATQAAAWQADRPEDAGYMSMLAALPSAHWIGSEQNIAQMNPILSSSTDQQNIPVFVIYMIPGRDCGQYSAGGVVDDATYLRHIESIKANIGDKDAIIILEPDAVAQATQSITSNDECLTNQQAQERFDLLLKTVDLLTQNENTLLYIDAGNSTWNHDSISSMAANLKLSGVLKADGFATNVSNFNTIEAETVYGETLSKQLNGAHFVIDTSRNGVGPFTNVNRPTHSWCNPPNRAVGHYPTAATGNDIIDAYLHIKNIGESDGADPDPLKCFGGPKAGQWWSEYALGLAQRWPQNLQPKNS